MGLLLVHAAKRHLDGKTAIFGSKPSTWKLVGQKLALPNVHGVYLSLASLNSTGIP